MCILRRRVIRCNRTRDDSTGGAFVRESCSRCLSGAQYRQFLDNFTTVFNNLFTRCQGCLRVEGGHLQHLLQHAIDVLYEEM